METCSSVSPSPLRSTSTTWPSTASPKRCSSGTVPVIVEMLLIRSVESIPVSKSSRMFSMPNADSDGSVSWKSMDVQGLKWIAFRKGSVHSIRVATRRGPAGVREGRIVKLPSGSGRSV